MGNELVPKEMQLPAHIASRVNQPSALAESIVGGIPTGEAVPKISIKASRFRIIEDGEEMLLDDLTLNTVIVGANPKISKVFYAGAWSADADPEAPDCFSLDGIKPDPSIAVPECDNCAECPNNAWGSKIVDDKELKACADKKRLAVIAADGIDVESTVYLLEVTPAALKNLNKYQKELTMRGIPVDVVKTLVSFDPDASFPKLVFQFGGFLEEDEMATVEQFHGSDDVLLITGEHEAPATTGDGGVVGEEEPEEEEEEVPVKKGSFGKKKAAPAKKSTAKKAAPKEEPEEEEEEEEVPVKKGSFGKKKAATKEAPAKKAAPKKAAAKKTATTAKAAAAADDDAQSLSDEIEDLLGDDFDD